jgi:hypothetical protein
MANASTTAARKKPGPKPRATSSAAAATGSADTTTTTGSAATPVAAAPVNREPKFKFALRSLVMITASKEQGEVRARADWATGNISYNLAYTSTSGEYKEAWLDEDLLTPIVERRKRQVKTPREDKL